MLITDMDVRSMAFHTRVMAFVLVVFCDGTSSMSYRLMQHVKIQ